MKNQIRIFLTSTLFILLAFANSSKILAQNVVWTRTYGGPGDDGGESMVFTSDGGIVIAGFKSSNNSKDVLIMKTDASGNEIWSRTYNLGLGDWGRSLKQTQDGGFIIAGFTEVVPQIYDPFLIKTDSAGNMQWYQQYDYGFGDDDRGHAVWQTSDGGYIIAGQTWLGSPTFGTYDMYVVKTDMAGNVQWRQTYAYNNAASPGADIALAVQQLSDGGYIIGGFTQSSSWASYIIRTDSLGNAIWSNIYEGAWQSECYDVQATPDGGFILTGTETSYTTDGDLLIIKLDANGNLIWKKIYGTVDSEKGESIQRLQDGGYIIAGMSTHGAGAYDMYVVRTNSTGDSLWSRTIGGSGDDRAFSVISAQDGSFFVTGLSWSFGAGLGDVYLLKLSLPVLNLKALIQGFYDTVSNKMVKDSVRIYLRNASSPYSIVDSSLSILDSNGMGNFNFTNAVNSVPYFIVIKHRNGLETWSATGNSFTSWNLSYDFTLSSTQAYGNNQILKGSKYCFYSGDVNQDGTIDLTDLVSVFNASKNLLTGYVTQDCNGDSFVDLSDLIITNNNAQSFISLQRP